MNSCRYEFSRAPENHPKVHWKENSCLPTFKTVHDIDTLMCVDNENYSRDMADTW